MQWQFDICERIVLYNHLTRVFSDELLGFMGEILIFDITLLYGVFFLSIDIFIGFEFNFITLAIEVMPKARIAVLVFTNAVFQHTTIVVHQETMTFAINEVRLLNSCFVLHYKFVFHLVILYYLQSCIFENLAEIFTFAVVHIVECIEQRVVPAVQTFVFIARLEVTAHRISTIITISS